MRTRFTRSRGWIALLADDKKYPKDEAPVLAAMTLHEGTGCWQLTDIRLSLHKKPSRYSGSLNADVLCAHIKPETPEAADYVKSQLREYKELEDGTILWCTFDGIVRGHREVSGYRPPSWEDSDQAGYFSQAEGLAKLKEMQAAWDSIDSLDSNWRIDNPLRQMSETLMWGNVHMIKKGYLDANGEPIEKPASSTPKP